MVYRPIDDDIALELERELQALQDEPILSDLESDGSCDSQDGDDVLFSEDIDNNDSNEAFLRLKKCIEETDSFVTDGIEINFANELAKFSQVPTKNGEDSAQISTKLKNEGGSNNKTDIVENVSIPSKSDLSENSSVSENLSNSAECSPSNEDGELAPGNSAREREEITDTLNEELEQEMRQFEEGRQRELQKEQARQAAIEERRKQQEERESECMLMALEDYLTSLLIKEEQRLRQKEQHLMKVEDKRERNAMIQRENELQRLRRELELMTIEDNAARLQKELIAGEIAKEQQLMKMEDEASCRFAKWTVAEMQRELQAMQIEDNASRSRALNERKAQRLEKLQEAAAAAIISQRRYVCKAECPINIEEDFSSQCERWIPKLHPLPSVCKGLHVRVLSVPGQALSSISFISRLVHLEVLDVSENPISFFNAVWLSSRLMTLSASNCRISSVVGVINCPVIQSIDLSQNQLVTLVIEAAPFLHTLRLDSNPLLKAPVLRWAPKLPDYAPVLNFGGWKGTAWQKRLQTNPKSVQEAVLLLSKPLTYQWRRNAAECIKDWWQQYSRRRKLRAAMRMQRAWRRFYRRRQACLIVQRWWKSVAIRNKVRQIRRRWQDADDDIERLNDDFFDFIRDDLHELMQASADACEVTMDAAEQEDDYHAEQFDGNRYTSENISIEKPINEFLNTSEISERVGDHADGSPVGTLAFLKPPFGKPKEVLYSTYQMELEQAHREFTPSTERSHSPASTSDQHTLQENKDTGWNFINEATRKAFEKKARRMRKLKAEKARREASPMQRLQYLRKSQRQQNRVRRAPTDA